MQFSWMKVTLVVLIGLATIRGHSQDIRRIDDAIRVSRQGLSFDARALGMGNAYSTIGYDFSALRFNPATMGFMENPTYQMSVNTSAFANTSQYYGTETNFHSNNTTLSQAGFAFPFHLDSTRRATLAFGYTQSKDFNRGIKYAGYNRGDSSFFEALAAIEDPVARALGVTYSTFDSSGTYLGDETILGKDLFEKGYLLDAGNMLHFSGGVSFEAVENVFFGISGSYNLGHYASDLELSSNDSDDVYGASILTNPSDPRTAGFADLYYRDVRSTDYKGWDIRFGILYRFENFIGVSVSFKVPTPHTIDETRYQSGTSRFQNNTFDVDQTVTNTSFSLDPPYELTGGAMVNLWILTGSAELTYVDYSQMSVSSGGDIPELSLVNKRIKDTFTAVVNANAGAEFRLPFTGLSARAGFMYRPSPYKGDPSRYDQKFLTLGLGIDSGDRLFFDLGYAYGWRDELQVEGSSTEKPVDQAVTYNNVLATIKFAF